MRDLFQLDLKDYKSDSKVITRPSVRAVVIKEDKVLLIYSKKYNYYKCPGGGINPGEDHKQALYREVKEESGFCILPDTISEFGRVLRRSRDQQCEYQVFEQENFYYFCDVSPIQEELNLDDYEKEEGFTPVWMNPFLASIHNRYNAIQSNYDIMVKREEMVLNLIDLEIRKRRHLTHEKTTMELFGNPAFFDMLSFVEEELSSTKTENIGNKIEIAYSRYEHTKRVLGWMKRLYEMSDCKEELSYEDIIIATIFHDVGRNKATIMNLPHAKAGVPIAREYLLSHNYPEERINYICYLIENHSEKCLMKEANVDKNLLLLMEADLLDDMGALGIVMDCMITEARNPEARFTDCLDHISRYTYRQQQENQMVTAAGRMLWEKKTKLVDAFVKALEEDVIL